MAKRHVCARPTAPCPTLEPAGSRTPGRALTPPRVDRRAFLAAIAAALTPLAAEAQSAGRIHRVGLLTPAAGQYDVSLFREGLRRLGYVEGANLFLDVRSAEGELDRLPSLASDLVKTRPDVIVAVNTPGARAAIVATKTVPIVMTIVGDPLAMGFVNNLARPGGNVTGVLLDLPEISRQ